jgi:hypothetical protein
VTVHRVQDAESGETLVIDPDIPGQIGWNELIGMARLAKQVPAEGIVVETGSLFGRSSFVWASNVHPSVTVYCIDPWVREQWIIDVVEKPQQAAIPFSLEAFRHYTRGCENIRTIQGYSPEVVKKSWKQPIDLFFDDSNHDEPVLSRNRDFWTQWVKPGGIFCGDEYDSAYPDCLRKTYELAGKWAVTIDHTGLFWWLRRPK